MRKKLVFLAGFLLMIGSLGPLGRTVPGVVVPTILRPPGRKAVKVCEPLATGVKKRST